MHTCVHARAVSQAEELWEGKLPETFMGYIKNTGQSCMFKGRCQSALRALFAHAKHDPEYNNSQIGFSPLNRLALAVGGDPSHVGLLPWAIVMYILHGGGSTRALHTAVLCLRKGEDYFDFCAKQPMRSFS